MKMVLLLLFKLILLGFVWGDNCAPRAYPDGTVCVCNATYCDTLSRPPRLDPPRFLTYTSNKAGLRFHQQQGQFTEDFSRSVNQIVIDSEQKFQRIDGWGGAFTDATGINIASLNTATQANLLRSYFSKEGIEYSLCRVPIGGTDFSEHGYSYDDGAADPELKRFHLAPEDFQYKLPFIKKALNLTEGNLRLFASAWTAPKWMKTNNAYSGVGFLKEAMYQSWADYFLKFLDLYQDQGVQFWAITTGNEPSLGYTPFSTINNVAWLPWQMKRWILNNLGPTLRNSTHSHLKVMVLDDQRFLLPWYIKIVLNDGAVAEYVDGIAVHWYYDSIIPPTVLTKTHEYFPDKFILATEACSGSKLGEKHVALGSWERGEAYAHDIIDDLLHWVVGWVDWNMALDLTGGPTYISNFVDSPIIVNAATGEFYKQPMFYCLGHFSKFVPRNSVRVYSATFDTKILVVAFQTPDKGTVVVILNEKDDDVQVTLSDKSRGSALLSITAKSVTTVLYW